MQPTQRHVGGGGGGSTAQPAAAGSARRTSPAVTAIGGDPSASASPTPTAGTTVVQCGGGGADSGGSSSSEKQQRSSHYQQTMASTTPLPRAPITPLYRNVVLTVFFALLVSLCGFVASRAADGLFDALLLAHGANAPAAAGAAGSSNAVQSEGDVFRRASSRRLLERRLEKWRAEALTAGAGGDSTTEQEKSDSNNENSAAFALDFDVEDPRGLSIRGGGRTWVEHESDAINTKLPTSTATSKSGDRFFVVPSMRRIETFIETEERRIGSLPAEAALSQGERSQRDLSRFRRLRRIHLERCADDAESARMRSIEDGGMHSTGGASAASSSASEWAFRRWLRRSRGGSGQGVGAGWGAVQRRHGADSYAFSYLSPASVRVAMGPSFAAPSVQLLAAGRAAQRESDAAWENRLLLPAGAAVSSSSSSSDMSPREVFWAAREHRPTAAFHVPTFITHHKESTEGLKKRYPRSGDRYFAAPHERRIELHPSASPSSDVAADGAANGYGLSLTAEELSALRARSSSALRMSVDGLYPSYIANGGDGWKQGPRSGDRVFSNGRNRIEQATEAELAAFENIDRLRNDRVRMVSADIGGSAAATADANAATVIDGRLPSAADIAALAPAPRSRDARRYFSTHPFAAAFGAHSSHFGDFAIQHPAQFITISGGEKGSAEKAGGAFSIAKGARALKGDRIMSETDIPKYRSYRRRIIDLEPPRTPFYDPFRAADASPLYDGSEWYAHGAAVSASPGAAGPLFVEAFYSGASGAGAGGPSDSNLRLFSGEQTPKNGNAVVASADSSSSPRHSEGERQEGSDGGNGAPKDGGRPSQQLRKDDATTTDNNNINIDARLSTTGESNGDGVSLSPSLGEPASHSLALSTGTPDDADSATSTTTTPTTAPTMVATAPSQAPPTVTTATAAAVRVEGGSSGSAAQLDLFPSFGYDKDITEIVQISNARDGVYYDVPTSDEALAAALAREEAAEAEHNSKQLQQPFQRSPYLAHYKAHGLPFRGGSFLTTNDWRGKCFYETHNFCVLNGTLTFFHSPKDNPNIAGGSLRMCTEFSQRSPTIRLKYETRPLPADGVLPAPLMTRTPGWVVQYWCQDLFHMTLTMLPAYQTLQKEFPKILGRAGVLEPAASSSADGYGEGGMGDAAHHRFANRSVHPGFAAWRRATGGGHDGKGPIPPWWQPPPTESPPMDASAIDKGPHYAIEDKDNIIHPDVFVHIAKGKRKKSAHCRVKLGDPRNWEDVRNKRWGDKQFPIAGNPYWPFYESLTSQPDRIYPLYRGATAKSACYTNGIIDKYYIKDMDGDSARGYTKALVSALGIKAAGARGRRCGKYRLTLIDRRGRTRRLTNIPEIAAAAAAKGFSVQAVALETLPIRKQLELIGSTDALVGMHGNGLTWLQFLPPGSAVVELVGVWYTPYSLLWGHKHFHSSMRNNMDYKRGGEFQPFAHNVTEIEALLDRVRAHLDSTSCVGGVAGDGGGGGGEDLPVEYTPPNDRLENLYKDCVPHC